MRMNRHYNAKDDPFKRRGRMLTALRQPAANEARPCRDCAILCARHASPTCPCGCSFACPDAPAFLSSDPVRYPIEARILPLVFELNALRLVQPCWSCEGHTTEDDTIHKLPSVWFYVDESDYASLLNRYLVQSFSQRRTHVPWIVSLTFGPEDSAFACRPDLWSHSATLKELQEDALSLAQGLREGFHRGALEEIARIDQTS